ncbi:MAG: hypothetical protein E6G49_08905, partial [Actinobacteria bacterium]
VTKADVLAAANGGDGATAAPARRAPTAGEAKPLRGPAGMLAQAMNESRSVPTATSFRTLPVDVLDAKRRALNSVLKERGMKVSFTHLVAWAIVQAATEWQVMGRSYVEEDGKPQVVEPVSINLGIAVDVERKDGSRSLMVPCIKAADELDFSAFHAEYEQAHGRRLPGNEHHAHQSGRTGHGRLGSAPDDRPGDDRRHGLDRLPGRVGARPRGEDQGAGHLEGHDHDLDLRSPDNPGRRVGVVPAPHRPAAAGRG